MLQIHTLSLTNYFYLLTFKHSLVMELKEIISVNLDLENWDRSL